MRMVASVGSSPSCRAQKNGNGGSGGVCCAVSSSSAAAGSLRDQYRMLRIQPGASEKEVKKAFRQLALQYHPDVCRGSNCSVQFHQITEAYDMVMSSLRQSEEEEETWESNVWGNNDKQTRGMYDDSDRDLWEEWMGWEGAGIRDYSSHINPIYEPSSYLRRIWSFDHSSS